MKKIAVLFCTALALLLGSCEKEETLHVDPIGPKYNLEDDPNDPIQHFIYETYRDFGIVVITNPTEADYAYNFTNKNRLNLVAPPQDPAVIQAGLAFIKKNFLDLYSAEFKKQNMPFTLVMAKSIVNESHGGSAAVDAYASTGMIAVSHIDENIGSLSDEQAKAYKAAINACFWSSYMGTVRNMFSVPEEFYQVSGGESGSEGDYGKYISVQKYVLNWDTVEYEPNPDYKDPDPADWYKLGFVNVVDFTMTEDPDYPYYDGYNYTTPNATEDLSLWTNFIFATSSSEIATMGQTYERIQQKYEILKKALEDAGCDLSLITQ